MCANVKTRLAQKHILLIEDDVGLNKRLVPALRMVGAEVVTVRECVAAGFLEVTQRGCEYDLIIVDVMLPQDEANLREMRSLDQELDVIRSRLKAADGSRRDSDWGTEFDGELAKRSVILSQRESLVCKDGGIAMIEAWLSGTISSAVPPVLFLTSVGSKGAIDRGVQAVSGHGDWLVKPVTMDQLIKTAVRLIDQGRRSPVSPG